MPIETKAEQVYMIRMGKDGDNGHYIVACETKEIAEQWILDFNPDFKYDEQKEIYVAFYEGRTRWAHICVWPLLKKA